MAVFYADSSVLLKRHVVEAGSTWVENLCDPEQGNEIATNRLSAVEVVSALNRRVREGSIGTAAYPSLRDDFLALCRQSYRLVQATNPILARARLLLERHALRSYDAIHLASALVTNDRRLAVGSTALTFLAADNRLLAAAAAEGLAVDNPNNYPYLGSRQHEFASPTSLHCALSRSSRATRLAMPEACVFAPHKNSSCLVRACWEERRPARVPPPAVLLLSVAASPWSSSGDFPTATRRKPWKVTSALRWPLSAPRP